MYTRAQATFRMLRDVACALAGRSVMEWKSAGVRMRRSPSPMQREMFGRSRFARPLSQEPTHPRDCVSAGTAGAPTFIWRNHAHWMWAYAIGRKRYQDKKIKISNGKEELPMHIAICDDSAHDRKSLCQALQAFLNPACELVSAGQGS